jgi:hypothetical protein
VHPLQPAGALIEQVLVEPDQGAGLQHRGRWDPRLRDPPLHEQITQQLGVAAIGLGAPFRAAPGRGLGRFGDVRGDPRPRQLLHDIAPPGAALQRERHLRTPGEALQPPTQVFPIRRGDPAAHHLPGVQIDVVECQLRPVNVDTTHDRHDDLPA